MLQSELVLEKRQHQEKITSLMLSILLLISNILNASHSTWIDLRCMSIMVTQKIVYLRYLCIDCVQPIQWPLVKSSNVEIDNSFNRKDKRNGVFHSCKVARGVGIDVDVVVSFPFYLSNKFLTIPKTYLCSNISWSDRAGPHLIRYNHGTKQIDRENRWGTNLRCENIIINV